MQNLLLYMSVAFVFFVFIFLILFLIKRKQRKYKTAQIFLFSTITFIVITIFSIIFGIIVRNNMKKIETMSYYSQSLPYEDLTEKQQESVIYSIMRFDRLGNDEQAEFYEAYRYYIIGYYIKEGNSQAEAEKMAEKLLKPKESSDQILDEEIESSDS